MPIASVVVVGCHAIVVLVLSEGLSMCLLLSSMMRMLLLLVVTLLLVHP